jgi:hypothetical protein
MRGLPVLMLALAAAALLPGCRSQYEFAVRNLSQRESIEVRAGPPQRTRGMAIIGPGGRYEFGGSLPNRSRLEVRRWTHGREPGEAVSVPLVRDGFVRVEVDTADGEAVFREIQIRRPGE